MSAGIQGSRFMKFADEKKVEEVGAAVQVWRNWKPVKAQAQSVRKLLNRRVAAYTFYLCS